LDTTQTTVLDRLWLWGPVAVYAAAIFAASSVSRVPELPGQFSDKTLHTWAFGGLALLLLRALSRATWRGVTTASLFAALVLTVLYGATDELHQWFVPGRTFDVWDLVADTGGALLAVSSVYATSLLHASRRPALRRNLERSE
jgi:VanZ family protein